MKDPIQTRIESIPRPTPFAASGLILLAAVGLWLSALLDPALPEGSYIVSGAAFYLPFVLLPLAVYFRRRPDEVGALRLNPLPLLPALGVVILAIVSVYVASLLTAAWGYGLDALGLAGQVPQVEPRTERELVLAIVGLAVLPAVCEELLFRGFTFSAWESRGTWFAAGVSAALFALLHGSLIGLPAYLLVGAVSAAVTFCLDSLYAGIAYHTVYNAACLILPWMARGAAEAEIALSPATVLSLALEALMLAGMMGMLLASFRMRAWRAGIQPIPRIRRPLPAPDRRMLYALLAELLISMAVVTALAARAAGGGGA